ncbi:MAG: TIGR02206 family membrane protein [Mobilicoccus sp.]|nr:TIGR02206 family membrane protein [Mobilicoccus sp.]
MSTLEVIGRMEPYGLTHALVLLTTAVAAAAFTWAARTRHGERILAALGWILLLSSLGWLIWWWMPERFDLRHSLPFHISDWLRVISAVALITRAGWAVVLSFYWGLTLNLQAFLTPALVYFENPPLEFGMFWFSHGVALVAPIAIVWGLGYRPTWRGFAAGFGLTLVWLAITLTVNAALGANYGFVSEPPDVASAIDLLGPWPWYLVSLAAILFVAWALMTWPFTTARTQERTVPTSSSLLRRRPLTDDGIPA